MQFTDDDLKVLTRAAIPATRGWKNLNIHPMSGGASDRRYWRLQADNHSIVLSHYTHKRPDNLKFVTATRLLQRINAACPNILAHDETRCLLWMEDLGTSDLWSHRNDPWPLRQKFYNKALRQAAVLHRTSRDAVSEIENQLLEPSFTKELYQWEQNYFLEHLVRPTYALNSQKTNYIPKPELLACWDHISTTLSELPRTLVHRDFQSQNVIIFRDDCYLIDYQGLRWGRPEYDVASLLFDPYVSLTLEERQELTDFHASLLDPTDRARALQYAPYAAAQRLMQALGAYGNLTRNLARQEYITFIPIALQNLQNAIANTPECAALLEITVELQATLAHR